MTSFTFFTFLRHQIFLLSSPPPSQPRRKSPSTALHRPPAPLYTPIVKLHNLIVFIYHLFSSFFAMTLIHFPNWIHQSFSRLVGFSELAACYRTLLCTLRLLFSLLQHFVIFVFMSKINCNISVTIKCENPLKVRRCHWVVMDERH